MRKVNLFTRWLSVIRGGKTESLFLALLIVALAVLLTTCAGGTGDEAGTFTLVTGSGTVTVNLLNASDYVEQTFYFGTASAGYPIGGSAMIDLSDNMLLTIDNGDDDIIFTGGLELEVGGFIDVNESGADFYMADDGDWLASKTVTVSGNETVVLTYPGDFTEVTGSGTVTVNLQNAYSSHAGKSFLYGTTSTGTPLGGQETIDSNGMLMTIAEGGVDVEFTGGSELAIGGFIDINGNGGDFNMPDDGDYMASSTVTVAGDTVATLTYE